MSDNLHLDIDKRKIIELELGRNTKKLAKLIKYWWSSNNSYSRSLSWTIGNYAIYNNVNIVNRKKKRYINTKSLRRKQKNCILNNNNRNRNNGINRYIFRIFIGTYHDRSNRKLCGYKLWIKYKWISCTSQWNMDYNYNCVTKLACRNYSSYDGI